MTGGKVLVTCNFWKRGEGNSCLQQTVPLARALRDQGHDVRYATPSAMHDDIHTLGFDAFPAGDEREFVDAQEALAVSALDAARRSEAYFEQVIAGTFAATMTRDILEHSHKWQPDLILREDTEFGGYLAAEVLGVPHVQLKVTGTRPLRGVGSAAISLRRAEFGLAPDPSGRRLDAYLTIVPMPPALLLSAPPNTVHVQPPIFEPPRQAPFRVPAGHGRPVIHVTSGNTFGRKPSVLRGLVAALSKDNYELIVTVGRGASPDALGELPATVKVYDWIPAAEILPQVDAVACHAGPATILSALSFGKPLLLAPFAFDHPWNAASCRKAGVADVVEDVGDEHDVRVKMRRLLEDQSFTARAKALQHEISQLPTPAQMANTITALMMRAQA